MLPWTHKNIHTKYSQTSNNTSNNDSPQQLFTEQDSLLVWSHSVSFRGEAVRGAAEVEADTLVVHEHEHLIILIIS